MDRPETRKAVLKDGDVNQHTDATPVKPTLRQDLGDVYRALDKFSSNATSQLIGPAVTKTIKGISAGARKLGRGIVDRVTGGRDVEPAEIVDETETFVVDDGDQTLL